MQTRRLELYIIYLSFLAITWVTFFLRCYVRFYLIRKPALDDWLLGIAQLFFTAMLVCSIISEKNGMGHHTATLTPVDMSQITKMIFISELVFVFAISFLRAAAAVFLLRFAIRRAQKLVIYIFLVCIAIPNIVFFFLIIFYCSPTSYFWTSFVEPRGGTCVPLKDQFREFIALSSINLVEDVSLVIIPIWFIWDLRVNRGQKIAVGALLSLSAIACAVVIARFPLILRIPSSHDIFCLGIMALSLAALRPLIRKFGIMKENRPRKCRAYSLASINPDVIPVVETSCAGEPAAPSARSNCVSDVDDDENKHQKHPDIV